MAQAETLTAVVARVDNQGDRVLLYLVQEPSSWGEYHIIASPEAAKHIKVGDRVAYEPCGFNFGWFKSEVPTQ